LNMTSDLLDNCPLCDGERLVREDEAPPREHVLLTDDWRVIAHRSGLPGWMLVAARSHIRSLGEVSASAAEDLGRILREGTIALQGDFGAVKSYVMQFSEGMLGHLHFSLVPRREDLPDERRGAAVGGYNSQDQPIGENERDAVAARLQDAWPTSVFTSVAR
jgi:diadenosine tetraphosphate (Ap4A) HIT family hydrolase